MWAIALSGDSRLTMAAKITFGWKTLSSTSQHRTYWCRTKKGDTAIESNSSFFDIQTSRTGTNDSSSYQIHKMILWPHHVWLCWWNNYFWWKYALLHWPVCGLQLTGSLILQTPGGLSFQSLSILSKCIRPRRKLMIDLEKEEIPHILPRHVKATSSCSNEEWEASEGGIYLHNIIIKQSCRRDGHYNFNI